MNAAMSLSKAVEPCSEEPTAAAQLETGRDDAHRSGRRVDDVGELRTGDVVAVADRTHHRAHREAVEVVVDEDERAEPRGGCQGALAPLMRLTAQLP